MRDIVREIWSWAVCIALFLVFSPVIFLWALFDIERPEDSYKYRNW